MRDPCPLSALLAAYADEIERYNTDKTPKPPEEDEADASGWQRIYEMPALPAPTTARGAIVALNAVRQEEGDDLCDFSANLIRAVLAYLAGLDARDVLAEVA
ncbi:hypothetical protein FHS55_001589 [Angulomicrobium tetraedrale]|uniref:Uncharacterized protein n=1 Tax=Ancylobacter tetraedralis TaxID=217068 RepID=A0A839Z2Q7_9HYPH|nr:hypothetical protein [Ancylobacter tetraedralis]MBB3770994.1 hypothetical protein [Ancylobacter tetraedralis]